jgi:hypothetical protein
MYAILLSLPSIWRLLGAYLDAIRNSMQKPIGVGEITAFQRQTHDEKFRL